MGNQIEFERQSTAVEPGTTVDVATTSTLVMSATAPDAAKKVIVQNISDEEVVVRLSDTGADAEGDGFTLRPGGHWEEEMYAGAVCARHLGVSGTVQVVLTII